MKKTSYYKCVGLLIIGAQLLLDNARIYRRSFVRSFSIYACWLFNKIR